jgi:signal transduction histidine kinase
MNDRNIEKELNEYVNKGLEIINKDGLEFHSFLITIQDILNSRSNQNEIKIIQETLKNLSSLKDIKPEIAILSSVISAVLKEKKQHENKLNDVTNSYDDVLGLITHEFKNILTSIHGYNMLLEKHLTGEKDKECIDYLSDSDRLTRQLFDMTDSLLKMSLGEKGLLKPELKLIDFVEDILEPVKRDLESQLKAKKMQIVLVQTTKNHIFECDEGLLDIVIRNLLINAIKYGKQNTEIKVAIDRNKKDFFVSVKNLSDEIPADLCDNIFQKFRSRKIGSQKGGTGIGLYNVKNIIHLHQGTIACKCLAGKWIEFKFNIPQTLLQVDR